MRCKSFYYKLVLLSVLLFPSIPQAKTVDSPTSKTVAKNYFALLGQAILPTQDFDITIENKFKNNTTYYIYGFSEGGFVIVSGDDSIIPVLGYSLDSPIEEDNMPPALRDLLNHYSEQINYSIESKTENIENLQLWNKIIDFNSSDTTKSSISYSVSSTENVSPLISTKWNQGYPYNTLCPASCPVGCGAVAMAQIMKYWNHPTTGNGSHSYYHSTYGTLSANFSATTYNWSGMPNSISSNNTAIATLMYHCGVALEMDYSSSGSSSYLTDIDDRLRNYFKYSSSTQHKWSGNYSSIEWKNLIISELNISRPVVLRGAPSESESGHILIVMDILETISILTGDGVVHMTDIFIYPI